MGPSLSPAALALAALCWAPSAAHAVTFRADLGDAGGTQPGWHSLSAAHNDLGNPWSRVLPGGLTIDVDPIGPATLDSRDRGGANGGGAEASMWRDFLFADGSTSAAPGSGLTITVGGLLPNATYPVRIWAFDISSSGGRRADWSSGTAGPVTLAFQNSPSPTSLADHTITLDATADPSGSLTLTGVVAASNPNTSHNVFVNGLEVGDPTATDGPSALDLSATTVARAAPVGTVAGLFATTDPTPGDSFTYSFAAGAGDGHNGLFEIDADALQTDRSLADYPGGTMLAIRVRTTDAMGAFLEKPFLIEVIDDSDGDGLDDTWELLYFPNLQAAAGGGDQDGDGLTNLEEQARGTNPTLADSDGDGLDDATETGTGIFASAMDTGSDPLVADTDGDGISDGGEVSAANGFVTDPNKSDTDGDGFADPLEISEGTDPTDISDFPDTLLALRINEVLARNNTGLQDGFGNREDWIEIHNPNNVAVNLDGYFLTDDPAVPTKWNFPPVTVPAGGFMVVIASGKDTVDPSGFAHSSFSISAEGEYLAIVRPDGTTIDDALSPAMPEQFTDISYGVHPTTGIHTFYATPTPGTANGTGGYDGVVKDTNFTVNRGFYDAPFNTAIATATPGASIRYTLDGSKPTPTRGTLYTGPVTITTTTTLRAFAYRSGWIPTNVDSQTYVFPDHVAQQPANPQGWPPDWSFSSDAGSIVPSDYEMDPRVVDNTLPGYSVREALLDIPSVAIAMEPSEFLNAEGEPATGIYSNPLSRVEKVCSIEYLRPDGVPGFQEDCKIEVHGNASRRPARMQKHSLRLTFSSTVGTPKLRYPLFPDSPVEEFNKLVLRACFTDSWALVSWSTSRYRPNDSQYVRDVWMKESIRAMGQPSSYGRFVHLYVNGLYWGVHDFTERLEDDFYATHLGGEPEDWEENADFSSPGSRWNAMLTVANGDIAGAAAYAAVQDYVDVENYADYMLLHFYADAEDWPTKNGYAAANTGSGDGRFRFFVWDQEIALDKFSWNRYSSSGGGGALFQRLRLNPEFRLLFADRAHRHLFNGGALSLGESTARYAQITGEIDKAIVAESARWGDVQATTPYGNTAGSSTDPDHDNYPPTLNNPIFFTREQHWVVERDNVINHHLPIIHDLSDSRAIINELRANNLYPLTQPPQFSQHGGFVPRGFELHMQAEDTVYYTTDGSDPRLEGGAVSPAALPYDPASTTLVEILVGEGADPPAPLASLVPADGGLGTTWTATGFDPQGWDTGAPGDLGVGYERFGTGDYTPLIDRDLASTMMDTNASVYLRYSFEITGTPNFNTLALSTKFDDGYVAYLNGVPIDAQNDPTPLTWQSASTGSHESAGTSFDRTVPVGPGLLQAGSNVLAIHGLNDGTGSSDFVIVPHLAGERTVSDTATPVVIDGSRTVRARVLSGGEWSALTEAYFSTRDLVVSEIMYHPAGDGAAEFIELMNIGPETLDISGVAFDGGISFGFASAGITTLAPGATLVLVRDQAAFDAAYGQGHGAPIAGVYSGALDNAGETLRIVGTGGLVLREFAYDDSLPWPVSADGGGRSLVLVAPSSNPDHNLASNWRPSTAPGGNPGTSDATPFAGDPIADTNGNGRPDILDYALGNSTLTVIPGETGDGTIQFARALGADDAVVGIETCNDLVSWVPAAAQATLIGRAVEDDLEWLTYHIAPPQGAARQFYIRLTGVMVP